MPFEPGNPYGGKRDNPGGRPPLDERMKEGRNKFYRIMYKRMLPLAAGFLLECLRSQRREDKKWATQLVAKKSIPDAFIVGVAGEAGASTLAGLIQQAAEAKLNGQIVDIPSSTTEKEELKDMRKTKIIIPSLVRRPGASKSMKEVWKKRKAEKKKFLESEGN